MSQGSDFLADLQKKFADCISAVDAVANIPVIPTGLEDVDRILGVGGIPMGRITELYGNEGCGKSTLATMVCGQCQRMGYRAAFLDYEASFTTEYGQMLGVDVDPEWLVFARPDTIERGFELIDMLVKHSYVGVIVIDSMAAMVPAPVAEGSSEAGALGLHARTISPRIGKLKLPLKQANVALLIVNQVRSVIGPSYTPQFTTPGGRAVKFYADVRAELSRERKLTGSVDDEQTGKSYTAETSTLVRVKVTKSKVAPPHRQCSVRLVHGKGFTKYSPRKKAEAEE